MKVKSFLGLIPFSTGWGVITEIGIAIQAKVG